MKKFIVLIAVLAAMTTFTGCTSMNQSVSSATLRVNAPAALVPDIQVGEKISGTASIQSILGIKLGPQEYAQGVNYGVSAYAAQNTPLGIDPNKMKVAEKAKMAAALKAVNDSGADLIVAPRYEVRSVGIPILYREISATVTGYKGTIKGFHQVKDEHLFVD